MRGDFQFNIDSQLLEPEARIPDMSNVSDALVSNMLLYSIAISLKKMRDKDENRTRLSNPE